MNKQLKEFLDSNKDGLFFIGHASALARINEKLILLDPLWKEEPYAPFWKIWPSQVDCDDVLDRVDYCFVSHIHADHFCPSILKRLKCPVFTMASRPSLQSAINSISDTQTKCAVFQPFIWWDIFGGIDFYFVPHPSNNIDSAVFIRNPKTGYTIYHGNDCFLDEDTIRRIKPDISKIDIAMVPFAYVGTYPHLLKGITEEERRAEIDRLTTDHLNSAMLFSRSFPVTYMIPCGGNIYYNDTKNHILNKFLVSAEDATEFCFDPIFTGDYILGDVPHLSEIKDPWPGSDPLPPINIWFDARELCIQNWKTVTDKVERAVSSVKNHEIHINGMVIDLDNKQVGWEWTIRGRDKTIFWFDRDVFEQWITGKISFSEAIGTRRFEYERVPNVYNKEAQAFWNEFL